MLSNPPNILMMVLDDADYRWWYNHPAVPTPNITRILTKGATFRNGTSSMPVCRPTLASLINGRSPQQNRIYLNTTARGLAPSEYDLPRRLKNIGYETFIGGKFWEQTAPAIPVGETHTPAEYGFTRTSPYGHAGHADSNIFVRDNQDDFLLMAKQSRPWFAYWAPKLPHAPYTAPIEYVNLVDPDEIPVPAWVADGVGYKASVAPLLANLAWVDAGIGDAIEALESVDALERTLIILVNDDGFAFDIISKDSPYNAGLGTHISFYWKGVIRAGDRYDPILDRSIIHTIADICGVLLPDEGLSIKSTLLNPFGSINTANNIICGATYSMPYPDEAGEATAVGIWAKSQSFRYIRWLAPVDPALGASHLQWDGIDAGYTPGGGYPTIARGTEHLFDMINDPQELTDVSANPAYAKHLELLRAAVRQWEINERTL